MNIKEIQQLIKFVSKSGVSEVKIESKDLKISVKTGKNPTVIQNEPVLVSQQPIVQTVPTTFEQSEPIIANEPSSNEDDHLITIKSPIIGTAYLAAEPGAKKFAEVGKKIKKGETVMIVEAMKTMNHVPSTVDGIIKEICVEDGQPVEYGQTIIIVE